MAPKDPPTPSLLSEETLDPGAPMFDGATDAGSAPRLSTLYEVGRRLLEQREPDVGVLHALHTVIIQEIGRLQSTGIIRLDSLALLIGTRPASEPSQATGSNTFDFSINKINS